MWSGVVSTTYLVDDVSPAQAGGVSLPLIGEVYLIYLMPLTFAFCCALLALGARYVSVTYQSIIGSVVALAVGIAWPCALLTCRTGAVGVTSRCGDRHPGRFVGWFRRNDGSARHLPIWLSDSTDLGVAGSQRRLDHLASPHSRSHSPILWGYLAGGALSVRRCD